MGLWDEFKKGIGIKGQDDESPARRGGAGTAAGRGSVDRSFSELRSVAHLDPTAMFALKTAESLASGIWMVAICRRGTSAGTGTSTSPSPPSG
jgi:hypothetical protein